MLGKKHGKRKRKCYQTNPVNLAGYCFIALAVHGYFFLPGLKFHRPSANWQQGLFQCAALWDFRNLQKHAT